MINFLEVSWTLGGMTPPCPICISLESVAKGNRKNAIKLQFNKQELLELKRLWGKISNI